MLMHMIKLLRLPDSKDRIIMKQQFRTAKTKSNKVIPIYRNHESNNSSSSISGRSLAVKDFINSIKNSKKTKKEKFITIGKLKK